MKKTTYIVKAVTKDGVLRCIGTVSLDGDQVVHNEHKLLDSEEELKRRLDAISARCVFER